MIKTGLFESIFKKQKIEKHVMNYFKSLTAYNPAFTSFEGGVYEMELTRAAIHSFANQVSKLKPEINGASYKNLERKLQTQPNPFMDTSKFLYRLATIYSVNNTAFIAPIFADDLDTIVGYYPLLPDMCEVMELDGVSYLRYRFGTGEVAAVEFSRAGIITQFQYEDDFFGEDNRALTPTMQLIHTQNQGIVEGVKNSAAIRFLAKLASTIRPEDLEKERERFVKSNLSTSNNGGVMIIDGKYASVEKIDSSQFIVDPQQMQLIQENVYSYFGVNAAILQNKFTEDEWNAFYEGKIEPFAIQASLALTNMTFTDHEKAFGNEIILTANRLQYASNATKLNIVTQLFDRGFITHNEGLEIFNMAPIEDGDKHYIRKEYTEVTNLNKEGVESNDYTGQGIPNVSVPGE